MELEAQNGGGRRAKNKEGVLYPRRRMLASQPILKSPVNEVKLAAVAVDLNIRLRSADMSAVMQEHAFRYTRTLLDADPKTNRPNSTYLAMSLKKEFDTLYGPAWHCIVGKCFGSFVTHSSGGFVYFSIEKLSFLLFKTEVRPIVESLPLVKCNENK